MRKRLYVSLYFETPRRNLCFVLLCLDSSGDGQHVWAVNHMLAPSPLSAGINTSSRGTEAASVALESQEASRGESGGLLFC